MRRARKIDLETGQVENWQESEVRKFKLKDNFVKYYTDGLKWVAQQNLTGCQRKVLDAVMCTCDWFNYVHVDFKEIAEITGMTRTNISAALRVLKKKEVLLPTPIANTRNVWMLNPHLAARGDDEKIAERRAHAAPLRRP